MHLGDWLLLQGNAMAQTKLTRLEMRIMEALRLFLGGLGCVLLAVPVAAGLLQSAGAPSPQQLRFEAASIKPTDPNLRLPLSTGVNLYPGGRLVIHAVPLKSLAAIAYDVSYWQIAGGEAWMGQDEYEIEAEPPEEMRSNINLSYTWYSVRDERLRAMLQALLTDRFRLRIHQDTKTGDVYLLERSDRPLKLKPIDEAGLAKPSGGSGMGTVGYAGGSWGLACDMPQLARFASDSILHATVTDQTGLKGVFGYEQASADVNPHYTGDQSASFEAFLSEAGLKLVRTRGPVETLVIDHAEKPTPN